MTTITARPVATASVATASSPQATASTTVASTAVASTAPHIIDRLDARSAPRARPSTAPALPAMPPNANSASIYAAEMPAVPAQTALAAAIAAQPNARKEDNADGTTTLWSPPVDGLSRGVRFSADGERLGPVRSGRSH